MDQQVATRATASRYGKFQADCTLSLISYKTSSTFDNVCTDSSPHSSPLSRLTLLTLQLLITAFILTMVLRANYAKRAEDQNQPPATDAKAGASRTRATAHDAARRRRQRNNGTTSNYAVEQAARRSQLKHTPRQLRFNVTTITTPPPQTDVEMRDAEPLAPAAVTTVPVVLPRNLPRLQDYSEVTREAMEAVHLGNGVDTIYALERLDTPS